jgi:hypothetical protein
MISSSFYGTMLFYYSYNSLNTLIFYYSYSIREPPHLLFGNFASHY